MELVAVIIATYGVQSNPQVHINVSFITIPTNKCVHPDYNKKRIQHKSIVELSNRTTNYYIQHKRKGTNRYM